MCASLQIDIPDFMATLDAMAPVEAEFNVTLNYRKGPAFTSPTRAVNEQAAVERVRRFAQQCGYVGAERKPTVYMVQA